MSDRFMVFVPGSTSPPVGPMTEAELRRSVHDGLFPKTAKVSKIGESSWRNVGEVVPLLIEEGPKVVIRAAVVPPTVAPPEAAKEAAVELFEVTVDGENVVGPVTLDQLRRGVEAGKLPGDAQARAVGSATWRPIRDLIAEVPPRRVAPRPSPVPSPPALVTPPPTLPKKAISSRVKIGLACGGVALVGLLTLVAWPDPAGRQLRAGKQFERDGKAAEALASYEKVCEWEPKGRACLESIPLMMTVRIKVAEEAIGRFAFREAEAVLAPVLKDGSTDARAKAQTIVNGKEMIEGLRWERASTLADKTAAMAEMERVAAAGVKVSPKAEEWLIRERPGVLLQVVRGTCPSGPFDRCKAAAGRLRELHPSAPETQAAVVLLNAATAAEERRIHGLLLEAEKLLSARAGLKRAEKKRQDCYLRELASNPDNAFAALHACGEGNEDMRAVEKLDAAWKVVLDGLAASPKRAELEVRWKSAEDDGDYKKQSHRGPDGSTRGSASPNPTRQDALRPGGQEPALQCGCPAADVMCNMRCSASGEGRP